MTIRTIVALLIAVGPAWAGTPTYELRSEKTFSNEIDGHRCKALLVKGKEVAWVFGLVETEVGLVARVCKEEAPPYAGAADPGTTYGGVLNGWYVIDPAKGTTQQLSLPQLDDFSNPSFCGGSVAYWGVSEGTKYSLVVANLKKKSVTNAVSVGELNFGTDYMYHLVPAKWSPDCGTATFADERYIKTTTLDAKSN